MILPTQGQRKLQSAHRLEISAGALGALDVWARRKRGVTCKDRDLVQIRRRTQGVGTITSCPEPIAESMQFGHNFENVAPVNF